MIPLKLSDRLQTRERDGEREREMERDLIWNLGLCGYHILLYHPKVHSWAIAAALSFPSLKQNMRIGTMHPNSESIFHRMMSPAVSSTKCCYAKFPSFSID